MMTKITDNERAILFDFLRENKLSQGDYLYRYTSEEYLERDENGEIFLKARTDSTDILIDGYHGQNHSYITFEIGKGLSFLSQPEKDYIIDDRICVKVKVQDILDQGGLIYAISSLPAYLKAFYCTIPNGRIMVKTI